MAYNDMETLIKNIEEYKKTESEDALNYIIVATQGVRSKLVYEACSGNYDAFDDLLSESIITLVKIIKHWETGRGSFITLLSFVLRRELWQKRIELKSVVSASINSLNSRKNRGELDLENYKSIVSTITSADSSSEFLEHKRDNTDTEQEIEILDLCEKVLKKLEEVLTPKMFIIWVEFTVNGLSHKEIGFKYKISHNYVSNYIGTANKRIRENSEVFQSLIK